ALGLAARLGGGSAAYYSRVRPLWAKTRSAGRASRDRFGQPAPLVGVQPGPLEQVRPPLEGAQQRLPPPPARDLGMVARQQHLRHRAQRVLDRPRVVRAVEQSVGLEAVLGGGFGVVQRPVL